MKKSNSAAGSARHGRVGDLLHRELAKIIRDECTDPRIGMITISAVVVTPDLSAAKVFFTVFEDDKEESSTEALNNAAGFFRTLLSKQVTLRSVPKLKFVYDESLKVGNRMNELLDMVKDNNQNDTTKDSASTE